MSAPAIIDRPTRMRRARMAIALAAPLFLAIIAPARAALAQRIVSATSPDSPCTPSPFGCPSPLVRFAITAPVDRALALATLRLTFDARVTFADARFVASDDFGAFSGIGRREADGRAFFLNFVDTGDPSQPGLPLTLAAGAIGFVDLRVTRDPALRPEEFVFRFDGLLDDGRTVAGVGAGSNVATSTVPEPSSHSLALLGGALLGGVVAAGRRRLGRVPGVHRQ